MEGASRQSLAAAREHLDSLLREPVDALPPGGLFQRGLARLRVGNGTGPDPARLAGDLFAVADLLHQEISFRRALADPAAGASAKKALLDRVLSGKVSVDAMDVLHEVVSSRWSHPRDLQMAIETLGVEAELAVAEAQGSLEEVEDELFRFGRIVESTAELSLALSDTTVSDEPKRSLVERLLADRANPVTVRLVQRAVTRDGAGRSFEREIDDVVALAAERRLRKIAVVQVALPLERDQRERLREALSRTFGTDIQLQVVVDPDVLGGIVVKVGDEVVDGSVARRLAEARRMLGR